MRKWLSQLRGRAWPLLLIYALLAAVATLPLVTTLAQQIPGASGDAYVHLWTFHHVKEALLGRRALLHTDLLFHPQGASLVFHTIAWIPIAFWLPLQALAGGTLAAETAAYSLTFIAIFAFNGYATYRLAHHLTQSRAAAFVAGLIVALWPYTLSHHDHPNLILIGFIPLSLLYLDRLLHDGRLPDALWAGLLLGLVAITRWQLAAVEGILIALFLLHRLVARRHIPLTRTLRLLTLSAVVAAIVIAPFIWPTLAELRDPATTLFLDETAAATDLAAYLVPSRYHPLWGNAAFRLYDNFAVNKVFVPFLGATTLLLALAGVWLARSRAALWTVAAAIFLLLALGPDLTVAGRTISLPMPYQAVDGNFFVRSVRHPDRLNLILSVPIALLAALGLSTIKRRLSLPPRRWRLLAVAAALLIFAEYAVHYETLPLTVPAWAQNLAAEPGDFAIATIPLDPRARADKENAYYQMTHGKPLVGGHVSRPSEHALAFINRVPLLRQQETNPGDPPAVPNVTEQMRLLQDADVRYLILNKPWLSAEQTAAWRRWLVIPPHHEDGRVLIYRTNDRAADVSRQARLLDGPIQIDLLHAAVTPTAVDQGASLAIETVWTAGTAVDADLDVCIGLRARDDATTELACRPLSQQWPSSRWRPGEIVHAAYSAPMNPYLPSGAYTVTLSLARKGEAAGRSAAVGHVTLDAVARTFAEPRPETPAAAVWGNRIRLAGYDLAPPAAGSLSLTLYWRALRRMDRSYKIFVHLTDPATGHILAQADTVPRNWTYPTTWWERGEVVEDTITLDLTGIPAGDAQLTVGVYEPDSGQRLPLATPFPQRARENALLLQTIPIK